MGRINKSKKLESSNESSTVDLKTTIGKPDFKIKNNKTSTISKVFNFFIFLLFNYYFFILQLKIKKNDDLKVNLLKQINATKSAETTTENKEEANFIKRPQVPNRLTNKELKSIINTANVNSVTSKKPENGLKRTLKQTLKKSVKSKIKKMAWVKSTQKKSNFKYKNKLNLLSFL
jgi:hypothetical protein